MRDVENTYTANVTDLLTKYNARYGAKQEKLEMLISDICEIQPTITRLNDFLANWKQFHSFLPKLADFNKWSVSQSPEKKVTANNSQCHYNLCDGDALIYTHNGDTGELQYIDCLCRQTSSTGKTNPLPVNCRSLKEVQDWLDTKDLPLFVMDKTFKILFPNLSNKNRESSTEDLELFRNDMMALYETSNLEGKIDRPQWQKYIESSKKQCTQYANDKRDGRGGLFLRRFKESFEHHINTKGVIYEKA